MVSTFEYWIWKLDLDVAILSDGATQRNGAGICYSVGCAGCDGASLVDIHLVWYHFCILEGFHVPKEMM